MVIILLPSHEVEGNGVSVPFSSSGCLLHKRIHDQIHNQYENSAETWNLPEHYQVYTISLSTPQSGNKIQTNKIRLNCLFVLWMEN